jgi:IclR family KDG regulon transcriptional repressor
MINIIRRKVNQVSQYEVATLKKGLMILDALQQVESMTLSEVMKKFSLNKTTTFRLLYTLELMGYVQKHDQSYSVTDKVGGYSNPYNARLNWLSVPPLYQLNDELGETINIGILHGTDVITTQIVDRTHAIRCPLEIGAHAPAHLNALGKVIMAFLDENDRENLVKQLILDQKTTNTFTDRHLLKEHLKVIRRQGYAIDDEETEIGLRCIAVPLFYQDNVIAALALSGPSTRLTKKRDKFISKKLIECSTRISKMLW